MDSKSQLILFLALIIFSSTAPRARAAEFSASPPYTLTIDVYSGVLSLDSIQKQNPPPEGFANFPRVIHLCHRVEREFVIGQSGEANGEKVVAVARVKTQSDGKLKIDFSELGRPGEYEGHLGELVTGPGDRHVFELPAIARDNGDTVRTVVVISTSAERADQNGRAI
jgi:hypothetical protein